MNKDRRISENIPPFSQISTASRNMALIILSQKLYVFPNTIKHPYGRSGESVLIISAYTKDKGGTSEEIPPVAYSIFRIQRRVEENISNRLQYCLCLVSLNTVVNQNLLRFLDLLRGNSGLSRG